MPSGRSSAPTRTTTERPGSRRSRYSLNPSEKRTASYEPVGSESWTTAIRLPVRIRRSCRPVTVPARRPAVAPRRTDSLNSAQVCTRIFCRTEAYSSSGCADI